MNMRKFKIIRDLEWGEDGEYVTLYDENNSKVMSGDWYHNKIDSLIDGFFNALDYLGIAYEVVTERINDGE